MKSYERETYWVMIVLLVIANMVLLTAIWFVGVAQRIDCDSHGTTLIDGDMFNCERHDK